MLSPFLRVNLLFEEESTATAVLEKSHFVCYMLRFLVAKFCPDDLIMFPSAFQFERLISGMAFGITDFNYHQFLVLALKYPKLKFGNQATISAAPSVNGA
jgi:hypothetical protein